LHRTTQNLAANAVRSEVRRRAREQEAATMNELISAEPNAVWEQIAPQLDSALGELGEADRDALLLRYFQQKSAREIADILGTSEEAAQKRVSRAAERLRDVFAKNGVTVGAGGLVLAISAHAVQAAPVGLAAAISAAVFAGATVFTTATATKTIAMTALQKALIAAAIVASVSTGTFEARQASIERTGLESLRQQQAPLTEQIRQLTRDHDDSTRQLAALREENEHLNRNMGELLKLRSEAGALRRQVSELGKLREETRQVHAGPTVAQEQASLSPAEEFSRHQKATMDASKLLGVAMRMYKSDNGDQFATNIDQLTNVLAGVTNFGGNVRLDSFELMNVGVLDDAIAGQIMFHERIPRQNPNGTWERIYVLTDGSVHNKKSDDGNFDSYEKSGMISPPPK